MTRQTQTQAEMKTGNFKSMPLSNEDLRRVAPSIFAGSGDPNRSSKYVHISSEEMLRRMRKAGFTPYAAKQAKARKRDPNFVKHMIRFRNEGLTRKEELMVGSAIPEVVMVNAHNGTSGYELMGGLFRVVCLNGLIIADRTVSTIKISHRGDILKEVIESSKKIISQVANVIKVQGLWQSLVMTEKQQLEFAKEALTVRFRTEEENAPKAVIEPARLLLTRRPEDQRSDLWTIFNRVQENVMVGGLEGETPARIESGVQIPERRYTSRRVNNIQQDIDINRSLWELAENIAAKLTKKGRGK